MHTEVVPSRLEGIYTDLAHDHMICTLYTTDPDRQFYSHAPPHPVTSFPQKFWAKQSFCGSRHPQGRLPPKLAPIGLCQCSAAKNLGVDPARLKGVGTKKHTEIQRVLGKAKSPWIPPPTSALATAIHAYQPVAVQSCKESWC
jgi:hypothetical protein